MFADHKFIGGTKGNDFVTHANSQTRELVAGAFGPLKVDVLESGESLGGLDVRLE
jgi:hypothetical protein